MTNVGPTAVDLTGVRFTGGVQFDFTGSSVVLLSPGQRVLVVRNKAAFESRYGTGLAIAGTWSPLTELSNGGDRLTLVDRSGVPIADFSYNDQLPWPPEADGDGHSLTLVRPAGNMDLGDAANWRPSRLAGGSPAASDALAASGYPSLLDYAVVVAPEFVPGVSPSRSHGPNASAPMRPPSFPKSPTR